MGRPGGNLPSLEYILTRGVPEKGTEDAAHRIPKLLPKKAGLYTS